MNEEDVKKYADWSASKYIKSLGTENEWQMDYINSAMNDYNEKSARYNIAHQGGGTGDVSTMNKLANDFGAVYDANSFNDTQRQQSNWDTSRANDDRWDELKTIVADWSGTTMEKLAAIEKFIETH